MTSSRRINSGVSDKENQKEKMEDKKTIDGELYLKADGVVKALYGSPYIDENSEIENFLSQELGISAEDYNSSIIYLDDGVSVEFISVEDSEKIKEQLQEGYFYYLDDVDSYQGLAIENTKIFEDGFSERKELISWFRGGDFI